MRVRVKLRVITSVRAMAMVLLLKQNKPPMFSSSSIPWSLAAASCGLVSCQGVRVRVLGLGC